jgi:hypothetical protein
MSGFKEGILEGNGLTIRYAESGEGQPIVVFPAGDGELFDDVAAELARHHRVIVLDVPVSGLEKIQDFAKNLSQSLAGLGVASFSVIGVSQGAILALAQAVYTRSRFKGWSSYLPRLHRCSTRNSELGSAKSRHRRWSWSVRATAPARARPAIFVAHRFPRAICCWCTMRVIRLPPIGAKPVSRRSANFLSKAKGSLSFTIVR